MANINRRSARLLSARSIRAHVEFLVGKSVRPLAQIGG
jgi:hypothetical protein